MQHHEHVHGLGPAGDFTVQFILLLPFILLLGGYTVCVLISERKWPMYRTVLWWTGGICAVSAVAGPLAEQSHSDFQAHMLSHLLLGMLAPLLMAAAVPVTLLLRTLPVRYARRVAGILKSRPAGWLMDPGFTAVFNMGALWILYTTGLFAYMHTNSFIYMLIHLHVFLAGYLFTASIIQYEPSSHRPGYYYRSAVLILAIAAHGILSKFLYANPPAGVPANQAMDGAVLMYYGGDAVDLALIILFCLRWYKAAKPSGSMLSRQNIH